MATYYVDYKNGNDSNNGTTGSTPKRTISSLSSSPTGGDEIRVAGQEPKLLHANCKIWNWFGDAGRSQTSLSTITYSTTQGDTNVNQSNHGLQTGETIAIYKNSNDINSQTGTINGTWEVTRVDANNFKLKGYIAPGTGSNSGGYWNKLKSRLIMVPGKVVENIAGCGQRPTQTSTWTASTNVTCTLETFTADWSSGCTWFEHQYGDKISISADFTTGKAAYWRCTDSDLSATTKNLSSFQTVSFRVQQKSGTKIQATTGNVSLRLCTDNTGDTSVHTIPIYNYGAPNNAWIPIVKDFGTNLNSSINSVALYVDTDQGAQDFSIGNIIATKSRFTAGGVNHQTLVGLKTCHAYKAPYWYGIDSLFYNEDQNETRVLLEYRNPQDSYFPFSYYTAGGVRWAGVGIARTTWPATTINMWTVDPYDCVTDMGRSELPTSSGHQNSAYFTNSVAGISSTNRISISGGWDASNNMGTQFTHGITATSNRNYQGYGLYFTSCSYAEISNMVGCHAYYPFGANSCSWNSWHNMGGVCGYYPVYFSSNQNVKGGCYIWGAQGYYNQYSSLHYWGHTQHTGITTIMGVACQYNMYFSSCNNDFRISECEGWQEGGSGPNLYVTSSNGWHCDRIDGGDDVQGGGQYGLIYTSSSPSITCGIVTCWNSYYGVYQANQSHLIADYAYNYEEDKTRGNGSYGHVNSYYSTYIGNGSSMKIVQGGTFNKRQYVYGGDLYMNNVVEGHTDNDSISQGGRIFKKNADGVSGAFETSYQYGKITPESSIRHTASGVSWKIDINSSTASEGAPVEWVLSKVICNANAQVTASIWVYRDGTGVNGGLRVKNGAAAGITANVSAVISDTTINSWVQCSMTFTPTEAGALDIYAIGYHVNNNSHNLYLDDFSVTQA